MIKKILAIAGALGVLGSVILNIYLFQKNEKLKEKNLVQIVADGDTLILKSGVTVRLVNIEAPELEFCGGPEAKKRLEELVLGKVVELETVSADMYHRPVVLVTVGNKFVNEMMLKEGLARYDGSPSPKREVLKKAYDFAFEKKIGIFSSMCRQEEPEDPKCLIKGNIRRENNKKYYFFPGCSEYERTIVEKDIGESWFCSEKEAGKAGFSKAANCFGKKYQP
jgi:endonuclease YncB( thermonuclease family)